MYERGMWRVVPVAALALLLGCSGKTMVESDLGIKGAPDWVNEGTQALSDKGGRLIHGVGSAAPLGDESLQRSTADNRARAEVARVLSTYMDVLQQDYTASVHSAEGAAADASVSRDIKSASQVVLNGAKIIGRWKDKKTGTVYSIAELDMQRAKALIQGVESMNQGLKAYVQDHGDAVFDRFAKEGSR